MGKVLSGADLVLGEAARSVWAKSPDDESRWLSLWQHMDDSAAVAGRLFDDWLAPSVVRLMSDEFEDDRGAARTALSFLAGIHDIGKATPAFAIQHDYLALRMRAAGLYMPDTKQQLDERKYAHHAVAGHHLVIRWLTRQGWPRGIARAWAVIVGGHHGVPPDSSTEQAADPAEIPAAYGRGRWAEVQDELLNRMAARTGAADYLNRWRELRPSQQFQILATGLVIISDWIASNNDLFPYLVGELPDVDDTARRAEVALAKLRLPKPWNAHPSIDDVPRLFADRFELPPHATPRPVQLEAVNVANDMTEPGLLIIEAPMGEGKTEAALAAAEALAARWGAGGLFVALPTQATTNAMFERIVKWLDRMGAQQQDIGGSITLSHGKARFNRLFRGLVTAGRPREVGDDDRAQRAGRRRSRYAVVAHSWLTGRKKEHLANFTVGTIDQVLFAGLRARHLMLRHLALAGKVVILDEIHAYDAYMNSYLKKVLTWLGAYRVPVLALSATLPGQLRSELVEAYRSGRYPADSSHPSSDPEPIHGDIGYPVLTWTGAAGESRTRVVKGSGRRTTIHLDALDDADLVETLCRQLADGGVALVVRNTVNRVLEVADLLERAFPGEVTVTHARYIVADRIRKDQALLERFGPPGLARHRPHRHIVVASQVVEQSLDVDFDLLVTDLAPVDLVLQRMGRLHRHHRDEARPALLRQARAYITGTDFTKSPPVLEEKAEKYVYDAHTLLRSAAVLMPRFGGTVELPTDIAPLVQQAYGPSPVGPPEWQDAMAAAEQQWLDKVDRRQDKASVFQIADPGRAGRAIVGWMAASVGDTDDEAEGQGQVRDGAPSLEVIVVQSDGSGQWHTPSWLDHAQARLPVPKDEAPTEDLAMVMATCAIRLPLQFSNAAAEEALWAATPPAWESSRLIYRMPALVIDEDGWGEINNRRVRYTTQRGLEVFTDAD